MRVPTEDLGLRTEDSRGRRVEVALRATAPSVLSPQSSVLSQKKTFLALCLALVASAACRQEMYDQPRYKPLGKSDFFADNRQARPPVEGTVARGSLREDTRLYSGKTGSAALVTVFPLPVTRARIDRGRQRYDIYCAPCHDRTGGGNGMVVQRGYRPPPSFHIDRLRQVAIGHFYDVITNGFGAMPDYAAQISPEDRWAIVAYVRALQLSQNAPLADVPPERRADLDKPAPSPVDPNSPRFPSLYESAPLPRPHEADRPGLRGQEPPKGSK
jgi:mono/diheme cytochrome c family protein